MRTRAFEAGSVIGDRLALQEHDRVAELLDTADSSLRYLLHGDCGVHNFLFSQGKLAGVIDPTPVVGDPVYDLIYAFCSSPDELRPDIIRPSMERLSAALHKSYDLKSEVLVGLYFRLDACIRHHPKDLDAYLEAWSNWTGLY
ncbi:phosphotransferase [Paenibacillus caui]|uniref:phosphotransferase n=1 Tax=Paenibacillus caui TaxID=2873927 RepID=UPI001F1762BA|nr:phosphotransferase [Paenibacillus caui]